MIVSIKKIHFAFIKLEKFIICYIYRLSIPFKVSKVRKKRKIKVLFILAELGAWKTELLYLSMLKHPRFEPILGVTISQESPLAKAQILIYLENKGYEYIDISYVGINRIDPDIIFYQKPYLDTYLPYVKYIDNLDRLFCYTNYYFFNTKEPRIFRGDTIYKIAWQIYVENESVKNEMSSIIGKNKRAILPTGLVMADSLLLQRSNEEDPWTCDRTKKRIIYAPHHSIADFYTGSIDYGTFDIFGEYILQLAIKYRNRIHMAFKPHPVLYGKLVRIWGQEKTDIYYNKWSQLEHTQFEDGEYVALFQYSDAMIHDCNSFTIEYMYMNKPALYLVRNDNHLDCVSDIGKECFANHYHGKTREDIEKFLLNVIDGVDPLYSSRKNLLENKLKPYGGCACDNIIKSILGD